jgi:hypothetical protein
MVLNNLRLVVVHRPIFQCFGIVRLLIGGSPLLRYQPIIVVCILMIGFSGD